MSEIAYTNSPIHTILSTSVPAKCPTCETSGVVNACSDSWHLIPAPREPAAREVVRVIDRNEDKTSVEVLVNRQWFPVSWPSYSQDAELYANRIKAAMEAYSAELRAEIAHLQQFPPALNDVLRRAEAAEAQVEQLVGDIHAISGDYSDEKAKREATEASLLQAREALRQLNPSAISRELYAKYKLPTPDQGIVFTLCKVEEILASTSAPEGTV